MTKNLLDYVSLACWVCKSRLVFKDDKKKQFDRKGKHFYPYKCAVCKTRYYLVLEYPTKATSTAFHNSFEMIMMDDVLNKYRKKRVLFEQLKRDDDEPLFTQKVLNVGETVVSELMENLSYVMSKKMFIEPDNDGSLLIYIEFNDYSIIIVIYEWEIYYSFDRGGGVKKFNEFVVRLDDDNVEEIAKRIASNVRSFLADVEKFSSQSF